MIKALTKEFEKHQNHTPFHFFVLSEESELKKSCYFMCIFWGKVALNLTWVLPVKTHKEWSLRG